MALIRLNNQSISSVTALPSGIDTGKIGQVINFTTSTQLSSGSSSYVDTNLIASITPSATSSKIYIQMFSLCGAERANAEASFQAKILRGATDIWVGGSQQFHIYGAGTSNIQPHFGQTFLYVDSPSSTSTLTYKVQAKTNSSSTFKFQYQSTVGSLILMEVLA
jgi:hypothetical protein